MFDKYLADSGGSNNGLKYIEHDDADAQDKGYRGSVKMQRYLRWQEEEKQKEQQLQQQREKEPFMHFDKHSKLSNNENVDINNVSPVSVAAVADPLSMLGEKVCSSSF